MVCDEDSGGCGGAHAANTRYAFLTLPNVICIHLKRFASGLGTSKVDHRVEFEETIDFSPFVHFDEPTANNLRRSLPS